LRELIINPLEADWVKAASIGFGFFMGIVPIWGFQLIVGISLAMLFRLNKALVILAAHISIPPMVPVILFVSHLTGAYWMGEKAHYISFSRELTFKVFQHDMTQYFLGAITLAIVTGIVGGLVAFVVLKIFKRNVPAH